MIDVIVTGQSLPALQTALDLAEVGLRVALLEQPSHRAGELATQPATESWPEFDVEGHLATLLTRIAQPVEPQDQPAVPAAAALRRVAPTVPLLRKDGRWLPESSPTALGIPAVPLAAESIALLGAAGAFVAYLDRITPLLTVGKTRLLGQLVQKRMGKKVRDRLVEPQAYARFGVSVQQLEVAVALPGLNETLSRAGALSSAVLAYADRNVARETRVLPSAGAEEFRREVLRRLALYGVTPLPGELRSVRETADGWELQLSAGEPLLARAVVADWGADPRPPVGLDALLTALAPGRARIHADIDIDAPAWLPAGGTAVTRQADWAAVVESDPGQGSAQPGGTAAAAHRVCLTSAAQETAALASAAAMLTRSKELPGVLQELGLSGAAHPQPEPVYLRAAPFHTLADRDAASAALGQLAVQHPTLVPVGRALHGDNQSAALGAAHAAAVHLRRRLLGLEE